MIKEFLQLTSDAIQTRALSQMLEHPFSEGLKPTLNDHRDFLDAEIKRVIGRLSQGEHASLFSPEPWQRYSSNSPVAKMWGHARRVFKSTYAEDFEDTQFTGMGDCKMSVHAIEGGFEWQLWLPWECAIRTGFAETVEAGMEAADREWNSYLQECQEGA